MSFSKKDSSFTQLERRLRSRYSRKNQITSASEIAYEDIKSRFDTGEIPSSHAQEFRNIILLEKNWEKVCGPVLCLHSRVAAIQGNILVVECSDGLWADHCKFYQSELMDKLTNILKGKKIKNIRFINGHFGCSSKSSGNIAAVDSLPKVAIPEVQIQKNSAPDLKPSLSLKDRTEFLLDLIKKRDGDKICS